MVLANFPFEEPPGSSDLLHLRAELQTDVFSVMKQLADLRQRSEQVMLSVAALYNNVDRKVAATYQRLLEDQPDESRVVVGHSGHRNQCLKVLKEAKKQVIIVNPWITRYGINDEMIQGMIDCLERKIQIDMGWGFQRDIGSVIKPGNGYWSFSTPMPWQYNAINELQKIRKIYPNTFRLKLIGTHAKVFLCENFAVVGSCNVLCSKPRKSDDYREELGLLTTDGRDIATLIDWFKKAPNLAEHKAKTHIA